MKEIYVKNWSEFSEEVERLKDKRKQLNEGTPLYVSNLLYRGQADSDWGLETTLDRFTNTDVSVYQYYRHIYASKPMIETFTGNSWQIPEPQDYEKWIDNSLDSYAIGSYPAYDYIAYLRHHGYPSPLLDWTASPYIAAYFAFNSVSKKTEYVSIFVFLETSGKGKVEGKGSWINSLGPYVRSHNRHFLQQSRYTLAIKNIDGQYHYGSHEEVFQRQSTNQDLLWKICVPVSEQRKALKTLDDVNINSFSLLGSEDSLVDTVAKREMLFREKIF